jgi:hypothetical protein
MCTLTGLLLKESKLCDNLEAIVDAQMDVDLEQKRE